MSMDGLSFNPPPGWPPSPPGWKPPTGWTPPPTWPPIPEGWTLWLARDGEEASDNVRENPSDITESPDDAERQTETAAARVAFLEAENDLLRRQLSAQSVVEEIVELNDARVLQDVGIYRYHHPLENAAAYQGELSAIEAQIAELVRAGRAIVKSELFTFNSSLAQGKKLSNDLAKLMLRAYNAEADSAVRSLRAGNIQTAKKRLAATRDAIGKLGKLMEMRISDEFHAARVSEIELTSDWLMKKQEEREAARDERARLREERRVQKELEAERAILDKEREHLINALATLAADGRTDEALTDRLAEIDNAIEENDFRAANIRAGYVYVISNEGAFGPGVVKIGLTRRLEPLERISELSGASVPFRFDVHTLFFSEDAVALESDLHRHFQARALNQANRRKEFFFATPVEVRDVLLARVGNILEFSEHAEATEYRQSVGAWPTRSA